MGIFSEFSSLFFHPLLGSQGPHVDPIAATPPDPSSWNAERRAVWSSEEMRLLRGVLVNRGQDERDSLLGELAEFHNEPPLESYRKCIHWERLSVDEWQNTVVSGHGTLRDFYNTTVSWRYDLAWYAYLQSTGYAYPQAVAVLRVLRKKGVSGRLLDFGSGIGVNAQLFHRAGFDVTIADVSKTLLDYSIWRFMRHGDEISVINLNESTLPIEPSAVITAFDVLVHVPDIDRTAKELHDSLTEGGWLVANFDTRAHTLETAWHLHDNPIALERRLERAGFVKRLVIGESLGCYQKVRARGLQHKLHMLQRVITMPILALRAAEQRVRWPTPRRVLRYIKRR